MLEELSEDLAQLPGFASVDAYTGQDGFARVLRISYVFSGEQISQTDLDGMLRAVAAHVRDLDVTYVEFRQDGTDFDITEPALALGVPQSSLKLNGRSLSLPAPWLTEHCE